jgi:hypothetical protein
LRIVFSRWLRLYFISAAGLFCTVFAAVFCVVGEFGARKGGVNDLKKLRKQF